MRRRPPPRRAGRRWRARRRPSSRIDQLPAFNRQNATVTLNVNMQEFQQKVLPASVYAGLPAPYNNGTFLWGYNINGAGPASPARTLEARTRQRDDRDLHQQPHQHAPAESDDRRPVAALGGPARHHRAATTASTGSAGGGVPAALRGSRSRPSCTCTARRCCPSTTATRTHGSRPVRRSAGRLLRHQHVQLRQPAGGDHAVVSRPRARASSARTSTPACWACT